ncbi:MAG: sensor histidine kinase [Cellvibrionaceae bacterium]
MSNIDYKAAYERQKKAREHAESILETRSRELYDLNTNLEEAYEQLKSQQAQILHQEKLASIGQLAAGIAHEINNPVGFIKSNLMSLKKYVGNIFEILSMYKIMHKHMGSNETDKVKQLLSNIEEVEESYDLDYLLDDTPSLINESLEGAERIIKIVNGLKTFSRVDSDKKEVLDINDCINGTIKLVENEIKFKAELKIDLGDVPQTLGFPGGFSQVILNLLVNASHAIDGFGEIVISTEKVDEWVLIKVSDNGKGIDDCDKKKIFNAFFTTKEVGVGTGLGLSISASIIEEHGGKIDVDSTLGKGTCFNVFIPVVDKSLIDSDR